MFHNFFDWLNFSDEKTKVVIILDACRLDFTDSYFYNYICDFKDSIIKDEIHFDKKKYKNSAGMEIIFSTQPGEKSMEKNSNGVFTKALLNSLASKYGRNSIENAILLKELRHSLRYYLGKKKQRPDFLTVKSENDEKYGNIDETIISYRVKEPEILE